MLMSAEFMQLLRVPQGKADRLDTPMRASALEGGIMKLRLLVVALIAALGTGCATTDKSGLGAYKIKPDSTVRHGAPDAQSYYQLARFYHGQKRLDKAELAYIKAIALDGGRVDSYNALGSLYAERGDFERAVQQFELAAGINPKSAYVQNNLGYAYYLQGRYEDAYQAVRRGLALDPKMQRGWINVGMIAKAQADKDGSTHTVFTEAVKGRRLAALPATLGATMGPDAEPVVEPIQESALNVADAAVPAAEPAAEVSRPTITPEAVGSASVAVQSPDPEAQVVVSADANEVSPRNSEENLAEGKFVLISTGREVVNLTVSAETAKPEPVATVGLATPPAPTVPALPVNPTLGDGLAIDLAEVDVEVTNANGVTGFAKKISAQLRNDNIVVKRITNHTSFQLVETVIEYQPGFENAAQALISRTKLPANLVPAKAPRDRSDVRIFLGRDIVETLNTHFASTS
ncbi:MAG: LytR C-terminal domain-containing protein, partial [Propionivibrio sp.]|nr:LytR C-terminal domain-containing protein [Propionivibrio sp.]